jgi:hypothetical protein
MFCFIALCSVATTVYARERSEAAKDLFKYPHPFARQTAITKAYGLADVPCICNGRQSQKGRQRINGNVNYGIIF